MVARRYSDTAMKLVYTRAEVFASRRDLSIRLPNILVLPRLSRRVPGSCAEALVTRESLHSILEQVVESADIFHIGV